jgi:hypothetical protein
MLQIIKNALILFLGIVFCLDLAHHEGGSDTSCNWAAGSYYNPRGKLPISIVRYVTLIEIYIFKIRFPYIYRQPG